MRVLFLSVFSLSCCILISSAYSQQMRPGKWEVTSTSEMSGMPMPMKIPAVTFSMCIDKQLPDKPPIAADKSCKFSNYKVTGDAASWKMECDGHGKMAGEGSIQFKGDTYTGNSTMVMKMGGMSMQMKNTYSGKRLGDC